MKLITLVHDLCVALLVGGLAAVFIAAFILFAEAPSREVAGQIGNGIFNVVAPGSFVVCFLLLGTVFARGSGRAAKGLALVAVVLAGLITFWLTPSMDDIWDNGLHASDGSGLAGDDRARFMSLHGMGSAGYMGILLIGLSLLTLRAFTSKN